MSVFKGARAGTSAKGKSGYKRPRKDEKDSKKKKYFDITTLPAAKVAKQKPTGELRFCDVPSTSVNTLGNTAVFANGFGISLLNLVRVGSSYYQREGSRIVMKSLNIRGVVGLTFTNTAAQSGALGRICIVWDAQPNGSFPDPADIWQNTDFAGNNTLSAGAFFAAQAKDRFVVLRDNMLYLPATGVGGVAPVNTVGQYIDWNARGVDESQGAYVINWHIPLGMYETTFKGNNGNLGDLSTGALYLVFLSSEAAATGAVSHKLTFTARLKYWP